MKKNTFITTKGIREAIKAEAILDSEDIYVDRAEGTYCVAVYTELGGHLITLDEILFCEPTGEMLHGKQVLQAVASDIDPAIIYKDIADMFDDEA